MAPRPSRWRFIVATFLAGCATVGGDRGQPLVPTEYQTRSGPYVVFTSTPLPADDGVIKQLNSLKAQFEDTLGLKVDDGGHPIEVYVLGDRKSFEHFLTFYYPGLPPRRAFFIAQGDRRVVYTFRSGRLDEDIRHEATHALIHLAVGNVPLWLDEGLAEYFEVAEPGGVNREHLAKLPQDLRDGWSPSVERLETLQGVQQMGAVDYRESWAWVHYLLQGTSEGRAALLAYLGGIRKGGERMLLSARLPTDKAGAVAGLKAHLTKLQTAPPAKLASDEGAVRLQDAPITIEPLAPAAKKRGFFSRLFSGKGNP
jgi:hypothetical protein